MNRRTLDLARLQASHDPYGPAATWLEEQAERRAEERAWPYDNPQRELDAADREARW